MQSLQLSSGDLIADRRASYAEMLFEAGDDAAADLMRDALALAPAWAAGWFRLGEMLERAERTGEAADAWREALRLDPQDRLGAGLKLAAAGHDDQRNALPSIAFVAALFDQYAADFDAALVERLDYRVPELLAAALVKAQPGGFAHMVDLGCGTGLMAERLAATAGFTAGFTEGVDVSAGMLRQAQAKGAYGRLVQADLAVFDIPASVDLVTAADVFMYVGALDGIVARVGAALPAGGMFAFSVEAHNGSEDVVLRPSRRYAHSQAYVRRLLSGAGLDPVSFERAAIRMDRGEPIEGFIVVARRTSRRSADATAVPSL